MLDPVPMLAPDVQPPAYHFHVAPVPSDPPLTPSVTVLPRQMLFETTFEVALLAATDEMATLIEAPAQPVVLQGPSART